MTEYKQGVLFRHRLGLVGVRLGAGPPLRLVGVLPLVVLRLVLGVAAGQPGAVLVVLLGVLRVLVHLHLGVALSNHLLHHPLHGLRVRLGLHRLGHAAIDGLRQRVLVRGLRV